MSVTSQVMNAMMGYLEGDKRRISHFMKVYAYAKMIGELEGMEPKQREILEIAAITHDIGIKMSEEKYASSAGHYQQIEGPPEAEKLLTRVGVSEEIVQRCLYLIAHHHTYTDIRDLDYQILVEADFLVNMDEEEMKQDAMQQVYDRIFKTASGKEIARRLYGLSKIRVAFVCVHNSCRSQIAEALGRHLASDVFESYSAGTELKDRINQDAVRLMKERFDIDMEFLQKSKLIQDIPKPDIVITMGCNVNCPYSPCRHREDWGLQDPSGLEDAVFHEVITRIEKNILDLKERIENGLLG